MPHMIGFELCENILQFDVNIRVCFMSAAELNIQALREVYPKARSIGCFIKKPVTINHLVKGLCGTRLVSNSNWPAAASSLSAAVLTNQKIILLLVK